jgi:hypothetical protein
MPAKRGRSITNLGFGLFAGLSGGATGVPPAPAVLAHGIPVFIPGLAVVITPVDLELGAEWQVEYVQAVEAGRAAAWEIRCQVGMRLAGRWAILSQLNAQFQTDWTMLAQIETGFAVGLRSLEDDEQELRDLGIMDW